MLFCEWYTILKPNRFLCLLAVKLLGRKEMSFLKKNFWTLSRLVLLIAMGICSDAWADGASIMDTATIKARNTFDYVKTITFILGGFGLVGIAFSAIMGKVKWTWFAGLAVGLGILGVEYATGSTDAGLDSTFGNI